jgi:hypothetical protein
MLRVEIERGSELQFADLKMNTHFGVTFERTLRIPDDGKTYPLPPGLGTFPIRRVDSYRDRVPDSWRKTSGVFIPMYQREALWINFTPRHWRPNAVKIAAGKVNAISGKEWNEDLEETSHAERQDYLVCPPQPWLDGFNSGAGNVRQFVAMPLGMGYTVEGQVTGEEEHGGIQIIVYEPKQGRFPEKPPPAPDAATRGASNHAKLPRMRMPRVHISYGTEMGLGAGGAIDQKIYPDPHGIDTWDRTNNGRVFVHIVNSMMWREITGEEPPSTPVTPRSYTDAGLPWLELYDEALADVPASPELSNLKSVAKKDAEHGFVGVQDDTSIEVSKVQIKGIESSNRVSDGER